VSACFFAGQWSIGGLIVKAVSSWQRDVQKRLVNPDAHMGTFPVETIAFGWRAFRANFVLRLALFCSDPSCVA
jgi:hypothetical protein